MRAIRYEEYEGPLSDEVLSAMAQVASETIWPAGQTQPDTPIDLNKHIEWLKTETRGQTWVHAGLAYEGSTILGYKLGRSNDPRSFESCLGGVRPEARRLGIASELSRRQAAWCRTKRFQFIVSETSYNNRAMLILNLKQGFYVSGSYLCRQKHLKVRLEKALEPS